MTPKKKKIAIVGIPLYGHVVLILPLFHALVRKGYRVDYFNTEKFKWVAERTGAHFVGYRSTFEEFPTVYPMLIAEHQEFISGLAQMKDTFIVEKYDFFIIDMFCYWAKYLAGLLDTPAASIHVTYPPYELPHQRQRFEGRFRSFFADSDEDMAYAKKAGLLPFIERRPEEGRIRLEDLALLNHTSSICRKRFSLPVVDVWNLLLKPLDVNFVFMPAEFDQHYHLRDHAKLTYVGSFHEIGNSAQSPVTALHGRKRVYVSLGTRASSIEPLIAELKRPQYAKSDITFEVYAGDQCRSLEHYCDENLQIHGFIDQHQMLSKVDVFVTHGGMGGIMEAILTNTPMIVIPMTKEQEYNARRITDLGLGIMVATTDLADTDLAARIHDVLASKAIHENLALWRQKVKASGGLPRAMALIESYLNNCA